MNKKVTRRELAENLYEHLDITQKNSVLLVDAFFNILKDSFYKHEEVRLGDLGKFVIRQKKERIARNIRKNEPAVVSARKVVVFKTGSQLRKYLKGKGELPQSFKADM